MNQSDNRFYRERPGIIDGIPVPSPVPAGTEREWAVKSDGAIEGYPDQASAMQVVERLNEAGIEARLIGRDCGPWLYYEPGAAAVVSSSPATPGSAVWPVPAGRGDLTANHPYPVNEWDAYREAYARWEEYQARGGWSDPPEPPASSVPAEPPRPDAPEPTTTPGRSPAPLAKTGRDEDRVASPKVRAGSPSPASPAEIREARKRRKRMLREASFCEDMASEFDDPDADDTERAMGAFLERRVADLYSEAERLRYVAKHDEAEGRPRGAAS